MNLTQSEFAKKCKRSRQAVSKAVKAGNIILTDGKIDVENPTNKEYFLLSTQPKKQVTPPTKKTVEKKPKKDKPAKSQDKKKQVKSKESKQVIHAAPTLENDGLPDYLKELVEKDHISLELLLGLSKVEVDKLKSYHQMQAIKIKAEKDRRELIPRKLVRSVFSKLYEIDSNQFLTLKDKLIPDLSALAGVNDEAIKLKMGERMDEELWRVLATVQGIMNKFLINMGDEEL